MRDAAKLRGRLTYSNVMSTIAVFMVLGGGAAVAANQLPKNSVGSPQIKKNAVKTGDIARNAVRVGKIDKEAVKAGKLAKNAVPTNRLRDNAVTGDKVNESTLSTVPSAQTSNSIVPPEGWHEVGAPGEVGFQNGWANVPGPFETAAFYKDHEGVVHLKGVVTGGTGLIFQLPSGYRPANGRLIFMRCSAVVARVPGERGDRGDRRLGHRPGIRWRGRRRWRIRQPQRDRLPGRILTT